MVLDTAYQQGTYLHLDNGTVVRCMDHGVLPCVFLVDRKVIVGNRIYRMECAVNVVVFRLSTGSGIYIAVIIIYSQTQNIAVATLETAGQFDALEKRTKCILCVLY